MQHHQSGKGSLSEVVGTNVKIRADSRKKNVWLSSSVLCNFLSSLWTSSMFFTIGKGWEDGWEACSFESALGHFIHWRKCCHFRSTSQTKLHRFQTAIKKWNCVVGKRKTYRIYHQKIEHRLFQQNVSVMLRDGENTMQTAIIFLHLNVHLQLLSVWGCTLWVESPENVLCSPGWCERWSPVGWDRLRCTASELDIHGAVCVCSCFIFSNSCKVVLPRNKMIALRRGGGNCGGLVLLQHNLLWVDFAHAPVYGRPSGDLSAQHNLILRGADLKRWQRESGSELQNFMSSCLDITLMLSPPEGFNSGGSK